MNSTRIKPILITLLYSILGQAQTYNQQLAAIFEAVGPSATETTGYNYTTAYSSSTSHWELDWDESHVFHNLISYTDPDNPHQSYELRMGKGGQIYSFKGVGVGGFGEALPPQWRPSWNASGEFIADQSPSDPIKSHHGNWATWNDEVWQMVGSDQNDGLEGVARTKPQNIHQAGPYMNNNAHRASDLTEAPFYSPIIQSHYDEANQSFTSFYWGQSENPNYVYDNSPGCNPCAADFFRPSTLFSQRYKNLGDGVIQVDFLIYNFHRTRGIDYWNVPWTAVRHSNLPYAFISNDPVNETIYEQLNTKIGFVADDPNTSAIDESEGYLPNWVEGATRRTSGNNSLSSGWFGFSNAVDGNGPSLAFITAKASSSPTNGYGDLRWGTALGPNDIRDLTIFSRRSIAGAADPVTGLKSWGIVGGESIKGRYFIVLDSSIDAIVNQIQSKGLVAASSIEKISFSENESGDIHYYFSQETDGSYTPIKTTVESATVSLKDKPFLASYPAFLMQTSSESRITSDPYYYSLKPYDGIVESIELMGYSDSAVDINLEILSIESSEIKTKVFPNPTNSKIRIESNHPLKNIQLFNMRGQELNAIINSTTDAGVIELDISTLASGLYVLKIRNQTYQIVKN